MWNIDEAQQVDRVMEGDSVHMDDLWSSSKAFRL